MKAENHNTVLLAHETQFWLEASYAHNAALYHPEYPNTAEQFEIRLCSITEGFFFPSINCEKE